MHARTIGLMKPLGGWVRGPGSNTVTSLIGAVAAIGGHRVVKKAKVRASPSTVLTSFLATHPKPPHLTSSVI